MSHRVRNIVLPVAKQPERGLSEKEPTQMVNLLDASARKRTEPGVCGGLVASP
jgi:hypothetical protein